MRHLRRIPIWLAASCALFLPMAVCAQQNKDALGNAPHNTERHAPTEAYIQTLIHDQNRELMARAERGDAEAQKEIGMAYEDGSNGLKQSDLKALEWFKKAAAQGDSYAIGSVGLLLLIGDIDLSPEDARNAALEWQKQHTGTDAIWRLSVDLQNLTPATLNALRLNRHLYKALSGLSCEADFITTCSAEIRKTALLTIKSIAETDNTGTTGAQTLWGELLFKPDIMVLIDKTADPETGRAYLLNGAETGDVKALVALGRVYEHGKGVPIDRDQAIGWYDRYVEQTKARKAKAEAEGHFISFEDALLVQCKLHFLRGDALRADTQFECERNRVFIQAY